MWGVGGSRLSPGLRKTDCTRGCRDHAPRLHHSPTPAPRLEPQGRARHSNWGGAGFRAPGRGRRRHRAPRGAWTSRNLTARCVPGTPIVAQPHFPSCPTALTRIYRQQRRHLGGALTAPGAHGSPRNPGGCPGRLLNGKEPGWSHPERHTQPAQEYKDSKIKSALGHRSQFPPLYSHSNKARKTNSKRSLKFHVSRAVHPGTCSLFLMMTEVYMEQKKIF